MKLSLIGLSSLISLCAATGPIPVSRSGLAGIAGFTFYNPFCAHGCFRSFAGFKLPCSTIINGGGQRAADSLAHDLAVCRASNFPYLSSIAWCIHSFCPSSVHAPTIEHFWEAQITGNIKILPKWSYGEVLDNVTEPPTMLAQGKDLTLNTTMITTYFNWLLAQNTLIYFFRETTLESYYGLSICLTAFGLPIVLTWLGYLPYMTGILDRIKPWLLPRMSWIGDYHDKPLPWLLGNVPTLGEGAYIAVLFTFNIVFLSVGYKTMYPRQAFNWYTNRYQELMAYFMWRTGVLAFCQMPVVFLFSSRNNVLLWLSNWSHSTYMLLHRWVARLFLLQALLHSILAVVLYKNTGYYASSLKLGWWIWGIVATVAAVIIVLTSFLIIRQRAYELFLITHNVMAVILVVDCWYHIWIGYEGTFGYETWIYATIAVWFFDRAARVGRILKTGIRRAKVTSVSDSIIRIDIPGIRWTLPGQYAYIYFPTVRPFRPWENHPFSGVPTALLSGVTNNDPVTVSPSRKSHNLEEDLTIITGSESSSDTSLPSPVFTNSGLTLFVRRNKGLTRYLSTHNNDTNNLLTLIEGPYPSHPTHPLLTRTDRLLLIGGGIGITSLFPYLSSHHPNPKLFYSLRSTDKALLDILNGTSLFTHLREKEIKIGQRLDIERLMREEAGRGWARIGVVVCGPPGMCDDVRSIIAALGKEIMGKVVFNLEVDSFSW